MFTKKIKRSVSVISLTAGVMLLGLVGVLGGIWLTSSFGAGINQASASYPRPIISSINPNTVSFQGGQKVTISGEQFLPYYQQEINLNPISGSLTNQQISFTVDTEQLITEQKLDAECQGLTVTDQQQEVLPIYFEGPCNNQFSRVWFFAEEVNSNSKFALKYSNLFNLEQKTYQNFAAQNMANFDNGLWLSASKIASEYDRNSFFTEVPNQFNSAEKFVGGTTYKLSENYNRPSFFFDGNSRLLEMPLNWQLENKGLTVFSLTSFGATESNEADLPKESPIWEIETACQTCPENDYPFASFWRTKNNFYFLREARYNAALNRIQYDSSKQSLPADGLFLSTHRISSRDWHNYYGLDANHSNYFKLRTDHNSVETAKIGGGRQGLAEVEVFEFLAFPRFLTSDEVEQIRVYLSQLYGINGFAGVASLGQEEAKIDLNLDGEKQAVDYLNPNAIEFTTSSWESEVPVETVNLEVFNGLDVLELAPQTTTLTFSELTSGSQTSVSSSSVSSAESSSSQQVESSASSSSSQIQSSQPVSNSSSSSVVSSSSQVNVSSSVSASSEVVSSPVTSESSQPVSSSSLSSVASSIANSSSAEETPTPVSANPEAFTTTSNNATEVISAVATANSGIDNLPQPSDLSVICQQSSVPLGQSPNCLVSLTGGQDFADYDGNLVFTFTEKQEAFAYPLPEEGSSFPISDLIIDNPGSFTLKVLLPTIEDEGLVTELKLVAANTTGNQNLNQDYRIIPNGNLASFNTPTEVQPSQPESAGFQFLQSREALLTVAVLAIVGLSLGGLVIFKFR